MLTAARNGEHVKQLEIVRIDHIGETFSGTFRIGQLAPLVEALLCYTRHMRNGGNAVRLGKICVIAFGNQLYLITQVKQFVIHRRRRKHQHLGTHARLDHIFDEACVAVFLVGISALVAEVVALVNHYKVVIAPTQMA